MGSFDVWLSEEDVARLDALRARFSTPEQPATREELVQRLIVLGMRAVEEQDAEKKGDAS